MNQGRTTAIFAAVAAVTLGLAWATRPKTIIDEKDEVNNVKNQVLFADFDDPDKATTLEIVKYDSGLGIADPFEITRDKAGFWKIPSHFDYPADAAEQVRDATTPLIDLKAMEVVSSSKGDHAYYGVLNPDDENLKNSAEDGVGMLVRVKDQKDNVLADLVIGKPVDKSKENQRYVRRPNQDAVYTAEIATTAFTTEFKKWIKGELLGVRGFDITSIGLRDYAILPTQKGPQMINNYEADLSYDTTKSQWNLDRMVTFSEAGQETPVTIGPNQELKSSSLNDLRTAVQGLEIVDVLRKPKGLAGDLKADKSLVENKESLESLYEQGFFLKETQTGHELAATGGETLVGTQGGVRYTLRFGNTDAKLTSEDDKDAEEAGSGLRRYLLVTASLDEAKFPLPDLEAVPETIDDLKKLDKAKEAAATPAANAPASDERPQDLKPAADSPAEPPTEKAADDKPADKSDEDKSDKPAEGDPSAEAKPKDESSGDSVNKPEAGDSCGQDDPKAESPAADQTSAAATEPAKTDTATADNKPTEQAVAPAKVETDEELKERLEATIERIKKANQQKLDSRNEKISEARKKVLELNARFAEWYYVVNESAYKKLKIPRDQLIVEKGAAAPSSPGGFPGAPGGLPPGLQNFQGLPGQQ